MNDLANGVRAGNVEDVIGSRRLGAFQVLVGILCTACAVFDGYDTQVIAVAAPHIAASWGLPASAFSLVFSAGLCGSFIGALAFGAAADRFGRKPALITAVLIFSLVSLTTPSTHTVNTLILVRFCNGLGLGGALPGVVALMSEYAPVRVRATVVSLVFCGFPLGAAFGGVAGAALAPHFGWQSLFYLGSTCALCVIPLIGAFVPESARFLLLKRDRPRIEQILRRMKALDAWNGEMETLHAGAKSSLVRLFTDGRALGTILLSFTFLLSLLLSYFLVSWLPLMARQAVGVNAAVLGIATLNIGAIVGCLLIGRLVDRFSPAVPIGVAYALGAVAIALIGQVGHSSAAFLLVTCLAGLFSIGAQMCIIALCAGFYETSLRGTGVGWTIGIGRIGAIFGPMLGGVLVAAKASAGVLFLVGGLVSLAAALGVAAIGLFVLKQRLPAAG